MVDDAARTGCAIKHGGRTLEHFDALKQEGIDIEGAKPVGEKRQAIHVGAGVERVEAADVEPVGIAVIPVELALHTGHILQHLVDLARRLLLKSLASNDSHRLWHLGDLGRGFHARQGGRVDVAADWIGALHVKDDLAQVEGLIVLCKEGRCHATDQNGRAGKPGRQ
ncbi:hypothetical protein V8352_12805 [Roseovarius sp. D0-M9]